jgi:hypothetical protein
VFSSHKSFGWLGFIYDIEEQSSGPVTPTNAYVLEDGVTFYVAEDGLTYYVQES